MSRSASSGPGDPASYCGSGPGSFSHRCTTGSMIRHWASTSSLRVKSVASPRMATYEAGSQGPAEANKLLGGDRKWRHL